MTTFSKLIGLAAVAAAGLATLAGPTAAGTLDPDEQPDLMIAKRGETNYVGESVINTTGTQENTTLDLYAGEAETWVIRVKNIGDVPSRYRIHGASGNATFGVKYTSAGENVTEAVRAGRYKTPRLTPTSATKLKLRIKGKAGAGDNDAFYAGVVGMAAKDPGDIDLVVAVVDNS